MGRAVRVDCRVRREALLRSSSGSLSVWVLVLTLPVLGRRGRRRPRVGSCVPADLDVVLIPSPPTNFQCHFQVTFASPYRLSLQD